jgi:hypothetical protein
MKFNSRDYDGEQSYYGAVRAVVDEEGNGNSEVTVLEFETPSGFAQLMEITILTGGGLSSERVFTVEDAHTVRIKITGEWEGGDIKHGLADLVHALKLKATLE